MSQHIEEETFDAFCEGYVAAVKDLIRYRYPVGPEIARMGAEAARLFISARQMGAQTEVAPQ